MTNIETKRLRMRKMLSWSAYTLLLIVLLPLIPYGLQAASDNGEAASQARVNPIEVPSPGAELWRNVRQRDAEYTGITQVKGVDTGTLINAAGEDWRLFRMQTLIPYGAILMGLILAAILAFYVTRGSVKIPGGFSGKKILRFTMSERMVHWATAGLFWLLGVTGLTLLYGRFVLIPLFGLDGFSVTASACKEIHNLFGPLFLFAMIALVVTFIKDNFFVRGDGTWLSKLGGLFGGHVSAGRFNAGEKMWFWIATLLGFALVITGLILDFAVFGQGRVVMELSHVVHGLSAVVMIAVSFGHIYLGTAGMEGSFSSMANGYVDENWAKAHHDLWLKEGVHPTETKPWHKSTTGGPAGAPR